MCLYDSKVSAGHEDVVRELVGAGADVKRTNDKGITPLCVNKCSSGAKSLTNHLISDTTRRQSLESMYVRSPRASFNLASSLLPLQIGRYLIQRGADVRPS